MPTLLPLDDLTAALQLRDLSDPAQGPHAMQLLLDDVVASLARTWGCAVDVRRSRALVPVEDNYDRLGYDPDDVTRDARYTRYASATVVLRSHTSAAVPPALRDLARSRGTAPDDVLLVLPGLSYRRDVIDRLHVGAPHQVDLWRITTGPVSAQDLREVVRLVVEAALPGARWRVTPVTHPYTEGGLQVDVHAEGGWVELAECGLAARHVLAAAGLDPARWSGLALGMGLDRALVLRKGLDDIRALRSTDPRVATQMLDLDRWRPVSHQPPVRRDLSIVVSQPPDAELLGDAVRTALGADADDLESVTVLSATPHEELPPHVQERLGTRSGQLNVLLRLVLRPLAGTLTDREANRLRDRVYAAVHQGPHSEWAGG